MEEKKKSHKRPQRPRNGSRNPDAKKPSVLNPIHPNLPHNTTSHKITKPQTTSQPQQTQTRPSLLVPDNEYLSSSPEAPARPTNTCLVNFTLDDAHHDNPQYCTDYAEDIITYLFSAEQLGNDYMPERADINPAMRAILINWIMEVVPEFRLSSETMYQSKGIVDRVLEKEDFSRDRLQLLGIVAMLISSKFNDVDTPQIAEFAFVSDGTCTANQIISLEKVILNDKLGFQLSFPTESQFLSRFLHIVGNTLSDHDKLRLENQANFYCESTLPIYNFIFFKPSLVALSSVVLALFVLRLDPWPTALQQYARVHWSDSNLRNCVNLLQESILNPPFPSEAILDRYKAKVELKVPKQSIFFLRESSQ